MGWWFKDADIDAEPSSAGTYSGSSVSGVKGPLCGGVGAEHVDADDGVRDPKANWSGYFQVERVW